ncbi:F-box only protein FBXO9/FBXO48 [Pleurotus pulmonarius]
MQPTIPPPEEEPEELARFREQWKAEVRRNIHKPKAESSAATGAPPQPTSPLPIRAQPRARPASHVVGSSQPGPSSETISGLPATRPALTAQASSALFSAVRVYRNAVQCESRGELDEAMVLYRQAFRMDPNVDRAYDKEERLATVLAHPVEANIDQGVSEGAAVEAVSAVLSKLSLTLRKGESGGNVVGLLAGIVKAFPSDLTFTPEDEKLPIFVSNLPDEVLLLIVHKMDNTTIGRFAQVCRKACLLALDPGRWRDLVVSTYKPPQISSPTELIPIIERHGHDYRRVFIEEPRVRLDGLYIAVCHYVRPGLSENHWVNISHLITYNRYLRFFPDGRVLSLLVNEEYTPQQMIPLLKYNSRMKGLLVGEWALEGTTIQLSNLIDSQSIPSNFIPPDGEIPAALLDDHITSSSTTKSSKRHAHEVSSASVAREAPRYVFTMTLSLRSRPVTGKWNKLDILDYSTVNVETGDVQPVALKQERPFWFSKVRSYA